MIEEWPEWASKAIEEHDAKVKSGEVEIRTFESKEELFSDLHSQ